MVGANVHNKVKVSSLCLLNSGAVCLGVLKRSGVTGGLGAGVTVVFSDVCFHIFIYRVYLDILENNRISQIGRDP